MKVVQRHMTPEDMAGMKECFLTGTAAEVTPVSRIGDYSFTPADSRQLVDGMRIRGRISTTMPRAGFAGRRPVDIPSLTGVVVTLAPPPSSSRRVLQPSERCVGLQEIHDEFGGVESRLAVRRRGGDKHNLVAWEEPSDTVGCDVFKASAHELA